MCLSSDDTGTAAGVALGFKRTARVQARENNRLARYAQSQKPLSHVEGLLRAAEYRERDQPTTEHE